MAKIVVRENQPAAAKVSIFGPNNCLQTSNYHFHLWTAAFACSPAFVNEKHAGIEHGGGTGIVFQGV